MSGFCCYVLLKMVLFHIAAIGWISPQTCYKIRGSYTKLNHIVKTKIGNLKATAHLANQSFRKITLVDVECWFICTFHYVVQIRNIQFLLLLRVARWHSGGVLDLPSTGHGFESQPPCCRVQPWASC